MIRFTTSQLDYLPPGDRDCSVVLLDGQEVAGRFRCHPDNPYIAGRQLVRWIKSWVRWNDPYPVIVEQMRSGDHLRLRTAQGAGAGTAERSHSRRWVVKLGRMGSRKKRRPAYAQFERDPKLRTAVLQAWPPECQVAGCRSHLAIDPDLRAAIVEVHHITHVSSGGADSPINLCLLCANHHALMHRAPASIVVGCDKSGARIQVNGLVIDIKRSIDDLWRMVDV